MKAHRYEASFMKSSRSVQYNFACMCFTPVLGDTGSMSEIPLKEAILTNNNRGDPTIASRGQAKRQIHNTNSFIYILKPVNPIAKNFMPCNGITSARARTLNADKEGPDEREEEQVVKKKSLYFYQNNSNRYRNNNNNTSLNIMAEKQTRREKQRNVYAIQRAHSAGIFLL